MPSGDRQAIFRVVTYNGKRHGFRLEKIYWDIIRLASARERMRIGAYVDRLVAANSSYAGNMSSMLRVHATAWMSSQLLEAKAKSLGHRFIGKIVHSATVPCFTMDASNRITSHNDLFAALLKQVVRDEMAGLSDTGTVRIRFGSDVPAVHARLAEPTRHFVDEELEIEFNLSRISRKSRIVAINASSGTLMGLLVFIET